VRLRFLTLLSLFFTACAVGPGPIPAPESQVAQDEVVGIGEVKRFDLHARLALKRGLYRDTMALDWHHAPEGDQLKFSTPLGTQIGEITETHGEAVLQWLNQPTKTAAQAELLLKDAIGVTIPLNELASWVQGRFSEDMPIVREGEGVDRTLRFSHAGWEAQLERWRLIDSDFFPGLVTLRQSSTELKMVIDHWSVQREN
jgi:outer membrane lipoprotein LolB